MSAPLFFTQKQRFLRYARNDTGLNLMTLLYQRGCACFLPLLLFFAVFLMPGAGFAQTSTLSVVDNEPVDIAPGEPGPGDNMVFSVQRNATYVVALSFTTGQPGEIVTHRLDKSGELEFVGRTQAGREPRQIAMARKGDYAVVVNSIDNELSVFSVGNNGTFTQVGDPVDSDGDNPYDVAVGYNDIVVVANRDSDQINTFHLDRRGQLTPLQAAAAGIDPHVVSVSSRGFVAVANQTDRSMSLFELTRRGELNRLGPDIPMTIEGSDPPANMTPRTLTWWRNILFVALDAPGLAEDLIRAFTVSRQGQVTQGGDTPCGHFLTDIEANEDGVFAVTANRNNPTDPTDDRDEARVYRINKDGSLSQDASVQTDNFPPSFKQVSTSPVRGPNDRHVIVSEFQSGWLRSLLYDRRRSPR